MVGPWEAEATAPAPAPARARVRARVRVMEGQLPYLKDLALGVGLGWGGVATLRLVLGLGLVLGLRLGLGLRRVEGEGWVRAEGWVRVRAGSGAKGFMNVMSSRYFNVNTTYLSN